MKKTLAILLALMLVFSSIPVAFAEEALPVDAQAAKDLGMLVGSGDGVTNAYLATTPSRIQAAVMFLRLKGLEATAKAFTGTDNFADADQAAWAKPIMAYLKANPTLGWIGNAGNFDPNGQLDAKSYYKVLLEAIGYKQNTNEVIGDFTFTNVLEFAASKGLTKVASVTNYTVNDLATATIEALKAKVNGSEKTLAASLVDAKVITEAAAVAAGVYTPVPVALAVESVTTDNLKQLTVVFNKEITAAGDEDNYELTADNAVLDASSDFALQADKKTVVITLSTEAAQQEVVELTVKGIEAVDESKLAETVVKDIELFDKTIPSAVDAKVVGNDTIKVTFSEPMMTVTADDFDVDGGDYIVQNALPASDDRTEWNVGLYSTLDAGNVSIEVGTGVEDYAGYGTAKKSFDLAVVEDTTAPVVVGFKDAKPTEVTLVFNEDIQFVDGVAPAMDDNFYHTNTLNDATSAEISGNELTLKFTAGDENLLPEGTAYVYVAKELVSDLWDNENAKIAYTVEVTLDKTAPTVTKVEAGDTESELVLTFSEDLDADEAQDETNYTILDKDGKEVADIIQSAALSDDTVTLTFTEDMSGDYSVVIENVEDLALNAIAKVTKAFNISDVTPPTFATDFTAKLYDPNTEDQMLKVSFGEAMAVEGKYSVVDLEKYVFDGINLSEVADATIKAVDGNKAVEISLPYDSATPADDTYDFTGVANVSVARVADAAGNYTPQLSGTIAVSPAGTVGKDTVELTADNTVVVTLLDRLTKFSASDFIVYVDSDGTPGFATPEAVTVSRVRHTLNDDGMSVVTFTLTADVATDGTNSLASGFNVGVATKAAPTSENIYGESLAAFDVAVDDQAAPVATTFDFATGTTIVITFSEALDASTFATGKNGFSVSGGDLDSAALADYNADGIQNEVVLTGTDFTENTNVYYNSVFGLTDDTGNANELGDISHTDTLK